MHTPNEIDYIEFCVSDMDIAKQFYTTMFGWEFTDYAKDYAGIKGRKKEMGGFTVSEKIKIGANFANITCLLFTLSLIHI